MNGDIVSHSTKKKPFKDHYDAESNRYHKQDQP